MDGGSQRNFGKGKCVPNLDRSVWPGDDLGDIADALTALVLGPDRRVRYLFVEGRRVVADGRLTGTDLSAAHRDLAERSRRLWEA